MGDVNLCSHKWNEKSFTYKKLAESLKNTLLECGLNQRDMCLTFKSDIIQSNGNIATSAIDHVYLSKELEPKTKTFTLSNSSTDHLPIMSKINKQKMRIPKMKTITRRSTKNYTKGAWNAALARNKWDNINVTTLPII